MFDSSFKYICYTYELSTYSAAIAAGAWVTKHINTLKTDETGLASLLNNQMLIPSGLYLVRSIGMAYNSQYTSMRLYNVTEGYSLATSNQVYAYTCYDTPNMYIDFKFQISIPTTFELQQFCQLATSYGSGYGSIIPTPYIYTMVEFFKYDS